MIPDHPDEHALLRVRPLLSRLFLCEPEVASMLEDFRSGQSRMAVAPLLVENPVDRLGRCLIALRVAIDQNPVEVCGPSDGG